MLFVFRWRGGRGKVSSFCVIETSVQENVRVQIGIMFYSCYVCRGVFFLYEDLMLDLSSSAIFPRASLWPEN